jgi:hypothetical protein
MAFPPEMVEASFDATIAEAAWGISAKICIAPVPWELRLDGRKATAYPKKKERSARNA